MVKQLCNITGYGHSAYGGELFFDKFKPSCPDNYVVKVMPNHIRSAAQWEQFFELYCDRAEKIYYTARKDFTAQCNSYAVCLSTQQWHPHNIEPNGAIKNGSPQKKFSVTGADVEQQLQNNLQKQAQLFRQWPGKLMWLEDRVQKPYARHNTPDFAEWRSDVDPQDLFL